MNKNVRYYSSFEDDFVVSKNQEYKLPDDYEWVRKDLRSRFLSGLIYTAALIFSNIYCRLFLHVKFKNRKILKETHKTGAFIYGNHTQPVGDVFNPALGAFPNRIYTVVSPANFGIPVIGKILPLLGALPIADNLHGMKRFTKAIETRINQRKCIVIYPEAHVWEYFTGIRPFADTAFKYPIKFETPVFSMTATYRKRKCGKRPNIEIYFDGPFYADKNLSLKEQKTDLRDKVYNAMLKRSENSNCEYIIYKKKRKSED